MKQENKPKYPNEKEAVGPKTEHRRRTLKWWRLQYKYPTEEAHASDRNIFKPAQYIPDWIDEHFHTFIDLDHALQQLNKNLRSYSWEKEAVKHRIYRLIHLKTKEVILLIVIDNKFQKQNEQDKL